MVVPRSEYVTMLVFTSLNPELAAELGSSFCKIPDYTRLSCGHVGGRVQKGIL